MAATVAYVAAALVAAWLWSPRVPYADAWRHYARLINTSFASGVLAADNGHPEVFANVVRWISLHEWNGNEDVQIVVGLFLAVATLVTLLRVIWTSDDLSPSQRAGATFAMTLGVFWLGNARALLHDNETLDVYSVLLCVALALASWGAPFARHSPLKSTIGATILCSIAAFNFGSGIASFGALFAVLFISRDSWKQWAVVGAGLIITLCAYHLLAGSIALPPLRPVEQCITALRWLAAPLIYLFWPFVDTQVAAMVPAPLDHIDLVARAWTGVFGDIRTSVFPQATCGALFVFGVLCTTLRARRDPVSTCATYTLGLALAWFGVCVSALIALTRVDYFTAFPSQVYAPRYLPWSSLAWAGWLVALVARRGRPRWILAVVACVGGLALSAEFGMTLAMRHQLEVANDTALAAVVGVELDNAQTGESQPGDVREGAAAMRRLGAGPFAWPEARLIGSSAPLQAPRWPVASWVSRERGEIYGHEWTLEAVVIDPPCASKRLLVIDNDVVVGLLRRVSVDRWRGVARADARDPSFQVGSLACGR